MPINKEIELFEKELEASNLSSKEFIERLYKLEGLDGKEFREL